MNTIRTHLLIALFAVLSFGAMGCTISATPLSVAHAPVAQTTVVHHTAPTRVYHNGRWLHYRSDGYYYRTGSNWVVASTVPTHVVSYHRPVHVHSRTVHRTSYSRPTHVRTSRPTHVRSSRPTQVRSSRPTHVRTTTSPRRTYRR